MSQLWLSKEYCKSKTHLNRRNHHRNFAQAETDNCKTRYVETDTLGVGEIRLAEGKTMCEKVALVGIDLQKFKKISMNSHDLSKHIN